MDTPTLQEIDAIRKEGMRPQVVGCFVSNKKTLLVYSEKYNLWQFPQGGIDNNEGLEEAVVREMSEELGEGFVRKRGNKIVCIGKDALMFPESRQGSRELQTDSGEEIFMRGKTYFFMVLQSYTEEIDIAKTEFDEYMWLPYEQAKRLAQNIYQAGKRRMTCAILDTMHERDII